MLFLEAKYLALKPASYFARVLVPVPVQEGSYFEHVSVPDTHTCAPDTIKLIPPIVSKMRKRAQAKYKPGFTLRF